VCGAYTDPGPSVTMGATRGRCKRSFAAKWNFESGDGKSNGKYTAMPYTVHRIFVKIRWTASTRESRLGKFAPLEI